MGHFFVGGVGRGVPGMQPAELRKVKTLYACVGEHETELSFEPNQIITCGKSSFLAVKFLYNSIAMSSAASMWGMWVMWVTHFILVGYVGYFFSCGVPI